MEKILKKSKEGDSLAHDKEINKNKNEKDNLIKRSALIISITDKEIKKKNEKVKSCPLISDFMKKSAFLDIDKELLNSEDDENVLNEITSNDKEVKSKILKYLPKKI